MGGFLRSSCRESGTWEGMLRSSGEEVPVPPPSSSVRSSTHSSAPKIEDEGFFDLRLRRSQIEKMGGSSTFCSEDRRWGSSIFGSEERRKKGGLSKNLPFFEDSRPFLRRIPSPSSKNPPLLYSFFGSEDRRTPPSSIARAEDWVEDRHGPRGGKGFTETNRSRYTGQQPGMKSARGSSDKPRIHRG